MDEKKRIAIQAAEEIQDGDAIFLDSGTTTYQIAMCLSDKKELTVITYDMSIATVLNNHPSHWIAPRRHGLCAAVLVFPAH